MTKHRKVKEVWKDGKKFYVDAETGDLISEARKKEIVEAETKRTTLLAEPNKVPLIEQQAQLKANVQKFPGMTAEESEIFARGRRN